MAANLLKNGDFEDSSSVLNNWNPYNAVPDTGPGSVLFSNKIVAKLTSSASDKYAEILQKVLVIDSCPYSISFGVQSSPSQ